MRSGFIKAVSVLIALAVACAIFFVKKSEVALPGWETGLGVFKEKETVTVYSLDYSSDGTTFANPFQLLGPGDGQEKPKLHLTFQLQGQMALKRLAGTEESQGVEFLVVVKPATFEIKVNDRPSAQNFKDMLMEATFVVAYDRKLRNVMGIKSDKTLPPLLHSVVLELFNKAQISIPSTGIATVDTWDTHESDSNGAFTAAYSFSQSDGKLKKSKTAYDSDSNRTIEISSGTTEVVAYKDLWDFKDLYLNEFLTIRVKDTTFGTSQVKLILSQTRSSQFDMPIERPKQLVELSSISQSSRRSNDEQRARNVLQSRTLKDVLDEFSSIASDPQADKAHIQRRLVAWAFLNPNDLGELVNAASPLGPNDYLFQSVIAALAESGSPQSHEALINLLNAKRSDAKSAQVVYVGMGMSRSPSEGLVLFLSEDYESGLHVEFKQIAGLSLASALRNGDQSMGAVKDAKNFLINEFKEADSEPENIRTMRNMGNLGANEVLEKLLELSAKGSSLQRSTAIRSLRFNDDPKVDLIYQKILREEKDVKIVAAVLMALSVHAPDAQTLEALRTYVRNSNEVSLQISGLDLIWKSRAKIAWAQQFRKEVAENPKSYSNLTSFAINLVD